MKFTVCSSYPFPRTVITPSVLMLAFSLVATGCQDPGSSKQLTQAEKKSMTTKSTPPQGMKDFMAKGNSGKPTGDDKSPWDKPQK